MAEVAGPGGQRRGHRRRRRTRTPMRDDPRTKHDATGRRLGGREVTDADWAEWEAALRRRGFALTRTRLGHGSFAWVFLATDGSGREWAIKVAVRDSPSALSEINVQERLQKRPHPHVITAKDWFSSEHWSFMVLPRCHHDMRQYLYRRGPCLSEQEVASFAAQLLHAVSHLHHTGVVHRDLKLGNLLLTRDLRLMLTDFGLSTTSLSGLTDVCGTPEYVAPEIGGGTYDSSVDAFSCGAVLFRMLTGKPPPRHAHTRRGVDEAGTLRALRRASPDARDFLSRLLRQDSKERLSVVQAVFHRFVRRAPGVVTATPPTTSSFTSGTSLFSAEASASLSRHHRTSAVGSASREDRPGLQLGWSPRRSRTSYHSRRSSHRHDAVSTASQGRYSTPDRASERRHQRHLRSSDASVDGQGVGVDAAPHTPLIRRQRSAPPSTGGRRSSIGTRRSSFESHPLDTTATSLASPASGRGRRGRDRVRSSAESSGRGPPITVPPLRFDVSPPPPVRRHPPSPSAPPVPPTRRSRRRSASSGSSAPEARGRTPEPAGGRSGPPTRRPVSSAPRSRAPARGSLRSSVDVGMSGSFTGWRPLGLRRLPRVTLRTRRGQLHCQPGRVELVAPTPASAHAPGAVPGWTIQRVVITEPGFSAEVTAMGPSGRPSVVRYPLSAADIPRECRRVLRLVRRSVAIVLSNTPSVHVVTPDSHGALMSNSPPDFVLHAQGRPSLRLSYNATTGAHVVTPVARRPCPDLSRASAAKCAGAGTGAGAGAGAVPAAESPRVIRLSESLFDRETPLTTHGSVIAAEAVPEPHVRALFAQMRLCLA